MQIFDSHAHYDNSQFDSDRDRLLGEVLPAAGVRFLVNVGNDYPTIDSGMDLAASYGYVYCSVGHHPHTAKEVRPGYLDQLRECLKSPKVVAVGEIGLDYHYDFSPRDVQKQVFREQLALAAEVGKPVIIHTREATADTLEILREFRPKGVVHCFSGSAETAREILDLGMCLGFTGVITFQNAKKPLEAAAIVPDDRLLIETDCPYMAPVPYRGKRCDSTMLPMTAAKLAEVRGTTPEKIFETTFHNACTMYGISEDS